MIFDMKLLHLRFDISFDFSIYFYDVLAFGINLVVVSFLMERNKDHLSGF